MLLIAFVETKKYMKIKPQDLLLICNKNPNSIPLKIKEHAYGKRSMRCKSVSRENSPMSSNHISSTSSPLSSPAERVSL